VADDSWRARAEVLQRRYNIQVLPYTPDAEFSQLDTFLRSLDRQADQARAADGHAEPAPRDQGALLGVHLINIGPFERLDLELDGGWNVLLGDNGVGKSTILRAIALALCGPDGKQYARRLVRIGQASGEVILRTKHGTYSTRVFREDVEAEVVTHLRPFEAEGWLPLGFSPLRVLTWERGKGPGSEGSPRPTSADVLPLLRGDVDPRMNNVKQWLVNLDYYAKDEAIRGETNGPYARLQQDFNQVIKVLLYPMQLEICVKDPKAGLVTAITADGEVPVEAVSQGTASLLGWIGVLLQRLHEVYDRDQEPRHRYALVLLDEIDAHMHPAWQRELVPRLSELFPNVQFIATTHSPLIVGGMPPAQLFRFARDPAGKVVEVELEEDSAMGRSDQVLRGQLFDLSLTLDVATEKLMAEYQLALADRSEKGEERRAKLEQQLNDRVPSSAGDLAERRAHELVEAVLKEQVLGTPEVTSLVIERTRKLLAAAARPEARL
jgi:predicted ATPase